MDCDSIGGSLACLVDLCQFVFGEGCVFEGGDVVYYLLGGACAYEDGGDSGVLEDPGQGHLG